MFYITTLFNIILILGAQNLSFFSHYFNKIFLRSYECFCSHLLIEYQQVCKRAISVQQKRFWLLKENRELKYINFLPSKIVQVIKKWHLFSKNWNFDIKDRSQDMPMFTYLAWHPMIYIFEMKLNWNQVKVHNFAREPISEIVNLARIHKNAAFYFITYYNNHKNPNTICFFVCLFVLLRMFFF